MAKLATRSIRVKDAWLPTAQLEVKSFFKPYQQVSMVALKMCGIGKDSMVPLQWKALFPWEGVSSEFRVAIGI